MATAVVTDRHFYFEVTERHILHKLLQVLCHNIPLMTEFLSLATMGHYSKIHDTYFQRSFSVVAGYGLDNRGSISAKGWEFFSSSPRPNRLWDPHSILSNRYRGFFHRGVKLTTHVHLVPNLIMRTVILPLPHKSSWRDTWLSTGTTLPLPS
jgi:hypothetical protein